MKALYTILTSLLLAGNLNDQHDVATAKKIIFVDDEGQKISFDLPKTWDFAGGTIHNAKRAKVGEFTPGTVANCAYKTGADYIKELRAGYPDDIGNPRFVGSRTLMIDKRAWTEGIRNVPAWDGKRNSGRWYMHSFFAVLNQKCFIITFYSPRSTLQEEESIKRVLASIRLL